MHEHPHRFAVYPSDMKHHSAIVLVFLAAMQVPMHEAICVAQPQSPARSPDPAPTPTPAPSAPSAKPASAAKPVNPAAVAAPRTDAGWVKRQAAFNERAKRGHEFGDIDIVFLGDSITQGWEGAGAAVWKSTFEPRRAVNFGIGGDRTQHVLYRIEHGNLEGLAKPLAGHAPRLVVIMIGTNNIGGDSAEQIAEGVGAIVSGVQAKLPEARVLLLGVFPRGEKPKDPLRGKVNAINERIAKLADAKRVVYLDIGAKFLEASAEAIKARKKDAKPDAGKGEADKAEAGTLAKEIEPDFLHFSAKGYQVWADAMEPTIKEMLGEKAPAATPATPPTPKP